MAVPLLNLTAQHAPLLDSMRQAFDRILLSNKFVIPSPDVESLETGLAGLSQTSSAIALSSGTDALIVALMALGIAAGDEVITTPFTFFATAGSIARLGAKPVFVDIEPDSFNIDPAKTQAAITSKTRAIMPVHLFGLTADMNAILPAAKKHSLSVIEDAAQAIGAADHGRPAGSMGDIGCLSFYPTKNLAALGDGGACLTNRSDLLTNMRCLRLHGQSGEYEHQIIGGNFRLDTIQAAMLNLKLPHLKAWSEARRQVAERYDRLLAGLPVVCPTAKVHQHHVYNQYTIRIPDGRRDAMKKHLAAKGIGHKVYYPLPLHLQPCFAYLGGQSGQCPVAEQAAKEVLSLPMYPELKASQQEEVANAIRSFYGER